MVNQGDRVITTLTRKPTQVSPALQAALAFVAVLGVGALLPWASDKPPHGLFYPFIILLSIGATIHTYRNPFPVQPLTDRPVEPPEVAARRAVSWGVTFGVIYFLIYYLGWDDVPAAWGQAFIITVLSITSRYAFGRKLPHPVRVQIIAGTIALAVFAIVKLLLRRH